MNDRASVRRRGPERLILAIGTFWGIGGVTVFLILALEGAYRAQATARTALRAENRTLENAAGPDWFAEFLVEEAAAQRLHWEPLTYFRRDPYRGRHINVDSAGLRRTIPDPGHGATGELWILGGSTVWGTFARDTGTLPSAIAQELADRPGETMRVVNFGETGYVLAQDVQSLLRALREREAPLDVVLYNGINDVFAAVQNGRGGWPQNEQRRREDFELGRRVYTWDRSLRADGVAVGATMVALARRSHLLERVLAGSVRPPEDPSADSLAASLVAAYRQLVLLVEALAREHGFRAHYVWQPTPQTTRKARSSAETVLGGEAMQTPLWERVASVHAASRHQLTTALLPLVGQRFIDLTAHFDSDSGTVFLDVIGHLHERANRSVAAHLADALRPRFTQRSAPAAEASEGRSPR